MGPVPYPPRCIRSDVPCFFVGLQNFPLAPIQKIAGGVDDGNAGKNQKSGRLVFDTGDSLLAEAPSGRERLPAIVINTENLRQARLLSACGQYGCEIRNQGVQQCQRQGKSRVQ